MEHFESNENKLIRVDKEFILENLNLVAADDFFKLNVDTATNVETEPNTERVKFGSIHEIYEYFGGVNVSEPDKVCRPDGDTTLFTTAGIQHIETIFRNTGELPKQTFMIAQPVIRSQFMDKTKNGTSTSFINFSVNDIGTTPEQFISLSNQLIDLTLSRGVNPDELRFNIEDVSDQWGDRKFTKTVLTLYLNGIEIGECIYMHDYPVSEDKKVPIADICLGIERLNWALDKKSGYFPDFNEFYIDGIDSNEITSLIDCIRTATLIIGEGVKPSKHNQGYRLRQLSKRFVARNIGLGIPVEKLVHKSYEYWRKWGFNPSVNEAFITQVINTENERNYNILILSKLEQKGGPRINIDINQPTRDFLKQVRMSLPEDIKMVIKQIIEDMK